MISSNPLPTLKSLIEEHARLDFSDFLSTLLAIFHVINKKLHPARLFRSALLSGTSDSIFDELASFLVLTKLPF